MSLTSKLIHMPSTKKRTFELSGLRGMYDEKCVKNDF